MKNKTKNVESENEAQQNSCASPLKRDRSLVLLRSFEYSGVLNALPLFAAVRRARVKRSSFLFSPMALRDIETYEVCRAVIRESGSTGFLTSSAHKFSRLSFFFFFFSSSLSFSHCG